MQPTNRLRAISSHITGSAGRPSATPAPAGNAHLSESWEVIKPWVYASVPRLPAGSPELRSYMEEHGYAIVASVLPEAKIETALGMLWASIEGGSDGKIDRCTF